MPLPKRPSGGAVPQSAALPEFGEPQNKAAAEPEQDFALPELDDFTLPYLDSEPEPALPVRIPKTSSIPKTAPNKTAAPDVSRNQFDSPASNNQDTQQPAKTAVSDALDTYEDEDEETALNRELGLLDDDDYLPLRAAKSESVILPLSVEPDTTIPEVDDDLLAVLEEDLSQDEDSDDEFENLLKGLEDITNDTGEDSDETDESEAIAKAAEVDDDWETALSELESFNENADLPETLNQNTIADDGEDDDDDEEEDDESWMIEDFTPPSDPFAIPAEFENVDADDEDSDEEVLEDDFVPPSDPFANPFADEEDASENDEEIADEEDALEDSPEKTEGSLKDKISGLLNQSKIGLTNYFDKLRAELHEGDSPKPTRRAATNTDDEEQEEEDSHGEDEEEFGNEDRPNRGGRNRGRGSGGGKRSPFAIFAIFAPIRSFYTTIVNILFGIITTILGILSKLPLIGFVFKIALEATRVLRTIAQYIPLVFFIGALAAVSYFSVPRDNAIGLPDSGGAAFNEFQYDAATNSASGTIVNTGDIIADVIPEFTVKSIQPTLNPVSWVIPKETSKCVATSVQVDIDSTINVTAKCGELVTGFIPRVTGELK